MRNLWKKCGISGVCRYRYTVCLILLCLDRCAGQSCDDYTLLELPNLDKRARNDVVGQNEPIIEDLELTEGYYNVGEARMPTQIPDIATCSTYYTVYMEGDFPSEADGLVDRVACQVGFFSNCSTEYDIKVRNCSGNGIYHLGPTLSSAAYCFDTFSSPPVPAPDCAIPSVHESVAMKYNEQELPNGLVFFIPENYFTCNFNTCQEPANGDPLVYWVSWYINDVLFKETSSEVDQLDTTRLYDSDLTQANHKLGFTVKCGVRVSTGVSGHKTAGVYSPGYFAGILIIDKSVVVERGQEAVIRVRPTVPIGCSATTTVEPDCTLLLAMFDPTENYDCTGSTISVKNSQVCGEALAGVSRSEVIDITDNDGDFSSYLNQEFHFTIATKDDYNYDLNRESYVLQLTTDTLANDHAIWQSYKPGDVSIQVVENVNSWKSKTCYAHNDPHMCSADGQRYEMQEQGEFIMYKHKTLPMEVQVQTAPCNYNHATCVCGTSIRAGGDLFLLYLCGGANIIDFFSCDDGILEVRRNGDYKYDIYLPIGTVISIRYYPSTYRIAYRNTMNVDISLALKDFQSIEGLCGDFQGNNGNGNPCGYGGFYADDFIDRNGDTVSTSAFATSWRVSEDESFLKRSNQDPNVWNPTLQLCVCPKAANITFSSDITADSLCSASETLTCTVEKIRAGDKETCHIKKRDTNAVRRKEDAQRRLDKFVSGTAGGYSHNIRKRQAETSNITLDEARELCLAEFNKTVVYEIKDELLVNIIDGVLQDCALDVQTTGDILWASLHITAAQESISTQLNRDSNFTASNPAITEVVRANDCPNLCSGNGACVNGSCVCSSGFAADDCSINMTAGCPLVGVFNNGDCDISNNNCPTCIPLYGSAFVYVFITTKIIEHKFYTSGIHDIMAPRLCSATKIRTVEAELCLDDCLGRGKRSANDGTVMASYYELSMSLDGTNFGNTDLLFVYDATCQQYMNDSVSFTIELKSGYCYIDGQCYADGVVKPTGDCYKCSATADAFSWTADECNDGNDDQDNNEESGNDYTVIVIAVSVAGGCIIIVIGSIILCVKCKHEKKLVNPSCEDLRKTEDDTVSRENTTFYEALQQMPSTAPTDHRPMSPVYLTLGEQPPKT